MRRADGGAGDMERGQIMKTRLWQAKDVTFYSEITGVCLKESERGRDMAIFVVGKCQSGHTVQALGRSRQLGGRLLQRCLEDVMKAE